MVIELQKKRLQNHVVVYYDFRQGRAMERCSTTFINATRLRLVITSPSPLFSTDLSNNTRVSRISCCRIGVISSLSFPNATFPSATRYLHKRRAISLFCIPLGGRVSGKTEFFCTLGQGQPMTAEWEMKGGKKRKKFLFQSELFTLTWRSIVNFIYEILKCVLKMNFFIGFYRLGKIYGFYFIGIL